MKLYLQLNDVGSGQVRLHYEDPKRLQVNDGQMIRFQYRGAERGGFFVENRGYGDAVNGDYSDRWVEISGRGPMRILDEAILWYAEQRQTVRQFAEMTLAGMLITFLTEAQARGGLTGVTWDFTAEEDSNGDAWGDTHSLDIRVGMQVLDLVRQFADMGVEFTMGSDLRLRAFKQAGMDVSEAVIFRVGQNCQEVKRTENTSELKNCVLVEGADSTFLQLNDLPSQATYRRREVYFTAGQAPDNTQAQRLAEVELNARKDPKKAITLRLVDADGVTPACFVDYNLGDWVSVDWGDGDLEQYRVRGLELDWGDNPNWATVTVELNSVEIEIEIRTAMTLRRVTLGAGGSAVSSTATPTDPSEQLAQHNVSATAHPNMVHDAVKLQGNDVAAAAPGDGDVLTWDDGDEQWEPRQPVEPTFLTLPDTPDSYVGQGGTIVKVKADESGLEFVSGGGSGNSTYADAYASRPAAENAGNLFLPTDGLVIERDTGSAWVPWGPIFPLTLPVNGDFSWVNQGSASVDAAYGGVFLTDVAGNGGMRIRKKAAPGAPYTFTAGFLPVLQLENYNAAGICLRESSSGKLILFHLVANSGAWGLQLSKWDNPTTYNSSYLTLGAPPITGVLFLRIVDDNTNRKYRWSSDGQHFTEVYSVGRTDFCTPDEIGFYVGSLNSTYVAAMTLLHWKQE